MYKSTLNEVHDSIENAEDKSTSVWLRSVSILLAEDKMNSLLINILEFVIGNSSMIFNSNDSIYDMLLKLPKDKYIVPPNVLKHYNNRSVIEYISDTTFSIDNSITSLKKILIEVESFMEHLLNVSGYTNKNVYALNEGDFNYN